MVPVLINTRGSEKVFPAVVFVENPKDARAEIEAKSSENEFKICKIFDQTASDQKDVKRVLGEFDKLNMSVGQWRIIGKVLSIILQYSLHEGGNNGIK